MLNLYHSYIIVILKKLLYYKHLLIFSMKKKVGNDTQKKKRKKKVNSPNSMYFAGFGLDMVLFNVWMYVRKRLDPKGKPRWRRRVSLWTRWPWPFKWPSSRCPSSLCSSSPTMEFYPPHRIARRHVAHAKSHVSESVFCFSFCSVSSE